jgi:hypothetical protein
MTTDARLKFFLREYNQLPSLSLYTESAYKKTVSLQHIRNIISFVFKERKYLLQTSAWFYSEIKDHSIRTRLFRPVFQSHMFLLDRKK